MSNISEREEIVSQYASAERLRIPDLEVLICTIGSEGIARVAAQHLPVVAGVEYVVAWQQPDTDLPVPPHLAARDDIRVYVHPTRGVSLNRNFAISKSTSPLVLMGDDDIDYSQEGLKELVDFSRRYPEVEVFCCRYSCKGGYVKPYPVASTDWLTPTKGWYISAIELAFRPESVRRTGVWFNEHISIGTPVLRCGEECIFMYDACLAGLRGLIVPVCIGAHDRESTGERDRHEPHVVMTHGAVMWRTRPRTWLPRLMVHAWREKRGGRIGWWRYMRLACAGISYARRHKVFESNGHID